MQKRDLTGERFGKLVALRKTGVDKYGNAVWECRCGASYCHMCGRELGRRLEVEP